MILLSQDGSFKRTVVLVSLLGSAGQGSGHCYLTKEGILDDKAVQVINRAARAREACE